VSAPPLPTHSLLNPSPFPRILGPSFSRFLCLKLTCRRLLRPAGSVFPRSPQGEEGEGGHGRADGADGSTGKRGSAPSRPPSPHFDFE
jgi:hypothetical protein